MATKTIGCLRDLGVGLQLDENGMLLGLDSVDLSDPHAAADPFDVMAGSDMGGAPAKRPATPPSMTMGYSFEAEPESAVTLGCIRDLFATNWGQGGSADEDMADLLGALEEALPDDDGGRQSLANTMLALTNGTSTKAKPGLATLFADEADVVCPPAAAPAAAAPAAAAPAAPAVAARNMLEHPPPPCAHNNWDNVRVKRGFFGLRCRDCSSNWKVPIKMVVKCPAFFNGYCPHGATCPLPHIHRYKNPEKERTKARGLAGQPHRSPDAHGFPASRDDNASPPALGDALTLSDDCSYPLDDESAPQPLGGLAPAPPQNALAVSPLVAPALAVGVIVHASPDPEAGGERFARVGGMGVVVAPGYDASLQAWNVRARDGTVLPVAAGRLRAVPAARAEAAVSPEERLEATFAVPLADGADGAAAPAALPLETEEFLQTLVAEKLCDPVFNAVMAGRPCEHNNWDNVRIVKGKIGLRCRTCATHWKVEVSVVVKCPAFFNGCCPNGVGCPLPHIHRYKNKAKEAAKARMVMSLHGQGGSDDNEQKSPQVGDVDPVPAVPEPSAPPASQQVIAAPCVHNAWTQVPSGSLSCNVCAKDWHVPLHTIPQCPAFFNGHCHAGNSCPMAHVRLPGSHPQ
eukprot:TRINITY_DN6840_c0_g2_i1.p1 TRINITY_DN6840_c0_g2~~TRINITY_DN6840_c0_g2_i1.p1  ORF type:complete len:631 (+),score=202.69 TRINITY_DN6840_c0_g2_i1:171-2063(+)